MLCGRTCETGGFDWAEGTIKASQMRKEVLWQEFFDSATARIILMGETGKDPMVGWAQIVESRLGGTILAYPTTFPGGNEYRRLYEDGSTEHFPIQYLVQSQLVGTKNTLECATELLDELAERILKEVPEDGSVAVHEIYNMSWRYFNRKEDDKPCMIVLWFGAIMPPLRQR